MKLVTTQTLPDSAQARLRQAAQDLEIVAIDLNAWETAAQEMADAEVIMGSFGGGSGEVFQRVMEASPKVRWIHTSSAGVDEILCPAFYTTDAIMTCGKGYGVANLLAEHALALLLALNHGLVPSARKRHWDRVGARYRFTELDGLTMGIIGYGGVARNLTAKVQAFGMTVLGVRTEPEDPPPAGVEAVWGREGIPELLRRSDVVVLILPNTPDTAGTFGEAELRQMKPDAILINVGRGQVCDGPALEKALVEGWIAGAGLDVMPQEPWPSTSPLWQMDNVLITPHIAGNSPQRGLRNIEQFCENFEAFVAGQPLKSVVDRQAGY